MQQIASKKRILSILLSMVMCVSVTKQNKERENELGMESMSRTKISYIPESYHVSHWEAG